MKLKELVTSLEALAPLALQEEYDNAGLITGDLESEVSSCLVCLDVTQEVLDEAINGSIPLIISHHPLIFRELKRITANDMVGGLLIKAIQNKVAIYAMHTNLDNIKEGVNHILSQKLGLENLEILRPMRGQLRKLVTFCPVSHADKVRDAIFAAGAGVIGNYDCCSYNISGKGSFRANEGANPFVGEINNIHFEDEVRIETILPAYLEKIVVNAMMDAHPYEEVAYDVYPLLNANPVTGAGMIGELAAEMDEKEFLQMVKKALGAIALRHSSVLHKEVKKVAVCGGSGSFLIQDAIRKGADAFVTADLKYHNFHDASGYLLLVDAGHFETEQFTVELIARYLNNIFPNFAVRISKMSKNPVNYL